MDITKLKLRYAIGAYETKSLLIRQEPFDLKSGAKSHIYLNHNNFLVQHEYLNLIADLYTSCIAEHITEYRLGVVDSIMSPVIVGAMSIRSRKDFVVIKSQKLHHGVKDDIFGDPKGDIVLIDDMTSTGGTLIEAAAKIREHGGTVQFAVVSASRNDTAKKNLAKEGIQLLSLVSFDEVLTLLEERLASQEKELVERERSLRSQEA